MEVLRPSTTPGDGLEKLLARLDARLRSILGQYRIPHQDAEDLLQDAFVLLIRNEERLRDPEAYLLTTLQYRCRMYWRNRGRQRHETVASDLLEDLAGGQAPSQESAALQHDLSRLLADLPPRPRRLIHLRYGLGYTAREVAEQLGTSPDSIRQQSTHARSLFVRCLNRYQLN